MIDVAQDQTYAIGDKIRAVLRFRWDGEFEAITAEFHRTTFGGAAYGNRIVLRSRNHQRVLDEGEPYTLVEVEGTVPETVRYGTYVCKYVRCLIPDRKSTRLNSSHANISYAVFCLKKKRSHS